ncbi:hypothetical protein AB205_0004040 [Aquarana catesbeiana]|uniref:MADF domain-containing protein n=1 Tax=Aquarana catesbeiana TaxID=8400 RepID=A0A2G9RGZ0_AQUCT|nr:hypothetical protein AB205_0004040 [Aquarana catesbeiana]
MKQLKDFEFMGQFIDRYRDMRNLREVINPLYRNKPARKASLEKLLQFMKAQVPDADIEFVDKKIGSLRSRNELNKVQASMRSGAAEKDVYVPILWYYNRMRFLESRLKPGNHFLHFHPPFPQPQLRLLRTNLALPYWKKLRSPAGARKTSARTRLWNVAARRRRG